MGDRVLDIDEYFSDFFSEVQSDSNPTKTAHELACKQKESDINNLNSIIGTWIKDQEQNTKLRARYAYIIFSLLGVQIWLVNVMMFLIGAGIFVIESSFFHWFLTLVVGEIIGFVYVVAKYLFKHNDNILEQIIKLLKEK